MSLGAMHQATAIYGSASPRVIYAVSISRSASNRRRLPSKACIKDTPWSSTVVSPSGVLEIASITTFV